MYSKFIKFVVLLSLLLCCGFAGRVLSGHFLNRIIQGKDSCHILCIRSGIIFPWFLSPYITQSQRRNTLMLGISMAEKSSIYKSWSLEELRAEASERLRL